jgi:F-type H+-transporting ATPase subunit gamma
MATLHDIKRRIGSVQSTQKITKAMKMVAASKLKRAQEAITTARPYALSMRDLVNNVALRADLVTHPLMSAATPNGKIGVVVVSSDRGLCGAFNSNIVNATIEHIQGTFPNKTVELTLVGKKGAELLQRRHDHLGEIYTDIDTADSVHSIATDIMSGMSKKYVDGELEAVYCLYNKFNSAISQEVTLEQLLPFEATEMSEGERDTDYLYEPSEEDLFEALLVRHLNIQMHRMICESTASEHGARMTAMESATTNAGDMIKSLTLQYNRARQSAITTELIEVISGAKAL